MHSSRRTIDDMMNISDGHNPYHYIRGGMIGGMAKVDKTDLSKTEIRKGNYYGYQADNIDEEMEGNMFIRNAILNNTDDAYELRYKLGGTDEEIIKALDDEKKALYKRYETLGITPLDKRTPQLQQLNIGQLDLQDIEVPKIHTYQDMIEIQKPEDIAQIHLPPLKIPKLKNIKLQTEFEGDTYAMGSMIEDIKDLMLEIYNPLRDIYNNDRHTRQELDNKKKQIRTEFLTNYGKWGEDLANSVIKAMEINAQELHNPMNTAKPTRGHSWEFILENFLQKAMETKWGTQGHITSNSDNPKIREYNRQFAPIDFTGETTTLIPEIKNYDYEILKRDSNGNVSSIIEQDTLIDKSNYDDILKSYNDIVEIYNDMQEEIKNEKDKAKRKTLKKNIKDIEENLEELYDNLKEELPYIQITKLVGNPTAQILYTKDTDGNVKYYNQYIKRGKTNQYGLVQNDIRDPNYKGPNKDWIDNTFSGKDYKVFYRGKKGTYSLNIPKLLQDTNALKKSDVEGINGETLYEVDLPKLENNNIIIDKDEGNVYYPFKYYKKTRQLTPVDIEDNKLKEKYLNLRNDYYK